MPWENDNGAHVATWAALAVLGQCNETFANTEHIPMSSFPLFGDLASPPLRAQRCRMLAVKLDNIFCSLDEAHYKKHADPGGGRSRALSAIAEFTATDANTVAGLGRVVDTHYQFTWGVQA